MSSAPKKPSKQSCNINKYLTYARARNNFKFKVKGFDKNYNFVDYVVWENNLERWYEGHKLNIVIKTSTYVPFMLHGSYKTKKWK